MTSTDVFIIGGGINGTAIAADAAGRGLSVTLCEKGDLASGTSSASTKLIHGGLRYLEQYEFGLVRHALQEREILLNRAPHLIQPMQFILPYEAHLRPAWMIRLGLFLYDHLAKRKKIPSSSTLNLSNSTELKSGFKRGFSYYDCFADDARLTIANALSAKNNHAIILPYHELISAERTEHHWQIQLQHRATGELISHQAKLLVNAAGPWINHVQKKLAEPAMSIKLSKGSHIVVPALYSENHAYLLQNQDNRVIFTIPYQQHFTLIGTTDVSESDDFSEYAISSDEKNYLCTIVNQYFQRNITEADIRWKYAGIRCLQADSTDNLAALSREHKIVVSEKNNLPLLTIIGGKITTHRTLAEHVVDGFKKYFPTLKPAWTAATPLPGGDFVDQDFALFQKTFSNDYPWLPPELATHYAKNYGTLAYQLLTNCHTLDDLGQRITSQLYQKEVDYLIQHEWARTAEDILWRRTKFGLFCNNDEQLFLSNQLIVSS